MNKFGAYIFGFSTLFSVNSFSHENSYEFGAETLKKLAGCYLIDYNYTETESLMPGYVPDPRVYDVNKNRSIKEWVTVEETGSNKIRLQHILFGVDVDGNYMDKSILKHQAEDWEYEGFSLYEFSEPGKWVSKLLNPGSNLWTRKITNLDDGLRYQCAAAWNTSVAYPEWSCDNFSPIPGRETRDMGRKDYNTLERSTKLIVYGNSWLERQDNVKVVFSDGQKIPLVKETGKNWYVRLPNTECQVAQEFVKPKLPFWALLRETWDEVLGTNETFLEITPKGLPPRYVLMWEIEEKAEHLDLSNQDVKNSVKKEIKSVIDMYRKKE